jgi:hypothetical protein
MSRRLTESLLEVVKRSHLNYQELPKVTMPADALVTFAAEIEYDLGAQGGSIYPLPQAGFKFAGISFEPANAEIQVRP